MVNAKLLVLSGLLAAHGVTGSAKNQDSSLEEGNSKNKTEIKNTPKETLSELDAKTIQLLVFFEGCSKKAIVAKNCAAYIYKNNWKITDDYEW